MQEQAANLKYKRMFQSIRESLFTFKQGCITFKNEYADKALKNFKDNLQSGEQP